MSEPTVLNAEEQADLVKAQHILQRIRNDYPETDMSDSMERRITAIVALRMDVEICPVLPASGSSHPNTTPVDSIPIPLRFKELCCDWHSGVDDKLYAVASTGGLTLGSLRPAGCDTDEKWYLTIWREFASDIAHAVRSTGYPADEKADSLKQFEEWADEWADYLASEYGLMDWDACDD